MESATSSSEASLRDSITEFRAADRLPREELYERARAEVGAGKSIADNAPTPSRTEDCALIRDVVGSKT
jgi:hypothetical protein